MIQDLEEKSRLLICGTRKLGSIYTEAALSFGISESAFWLLYAVSDSEKEYSQQKICDEWAIPKQTLNSSVKCLIKRNLIALDQARSPNDRKQKIIRLTSDGELFVSRNIQKFKEKEQQVLSELTEHEQDDYISLMQKHISCFQEMTNL